MLNKVTKIIVFNGAPGSGKDTGADYLEKRFFASVVSIAAPVKRHVAAIYKFNTVASLDEEKDIPHPRLYKKTPRECYIAHGEMMKAFHGDSFWIDKAIDDIQVMEKLDPDPLYVIPDVGFQIEIDSLIEAFGIGNILLIYLEREGCTFENDSRSRVAFFNGLATARVYNNGTIEQYQQYLGKVVEEWLNAPY